MSGILCEICETEIEYDSVYGGWRHVKPIYSHLPKITEEINGNEQNLLNELAKECHCCEHCCEKPCEGLIGGGGCHEMCICDFERG
jgi:hypothetical protein